MKEAIISTSRLNCYGTRVLTEGIDTEQYSKNPVLLFMHRRGRKEDMPIGVIENLRVEGDMLLGTPRFDDDTEDERNIAKKWERGTLRMLSAGLDIVEWSEDPAVLVAGQTRPTITKSKLTEVSVVDIGANDDALQVGLYHEGRLLTLAAGEENDHLPLLKQKEEETNEPKQQNNKMEKILLKLGLASDATEDQAVEAIGRLQEERNTMNLARITDTVEAAIKDKRIEAGKKEKYITLGKQLGHDGLKDLLDDMRPVVKPLDLIRQSGSAGSGEKTGLKWETATADELADLRDNNRDEYIRLYKDHFGFEPRF